jgi:hypothetical protein
MPHAYTEDQLVGQPAIGLFAELGWQVAGPAPKADVAGEPRDAGVDRARNQGRSCACSPIAGGVGEAEAHFVARGHRHHRVEPDTST